MTPIFENVYDLIGCIAIVYLVVSLIVLFCVFAFVYYAKQCWQEKEYIDTLDEHDRSVVLNYKLSKQVLFKSKKRER